MPRDVQPLPKNKIKRVADELNELRQALDRVVPFLYQEYREPESTLTYEECRKIVRALEAVKGKMKSELGWFSHFNQLISHTQHLMRQMRKLKT